MKLVIGIHETLQGIKGNRDPDIDSILLQKLDFYVKNGEFLSENLLKPNEYIYILQEIEQIYSEIFSTIEKIMVIASEFYHQKYFNKYLLG